MSQTPTPEEELIQNETGDTPPPAPFHAVVNADLFRRVQLACPRNGTLITSGVYLEPCSKGGAILTAYNGHYFICIRDPFAVVRGAGLVKLNKAMLRALKPEKQDVAHSERVLMVSCDQDNPDKAMVASAWIEDRISSRELIFDLFDAPTEQVHAIQVKDVRVDVPYPNYRGIVPDYPVSGEAFATFNPEATHTIGQALAPYGKLTPTLTFYTHPAEPESHAILIKGPHFPLLHSDEWFEGFAVLQTLKGPDPDGTRPAWLGKV